MESELGRRVLLVGGVLFGAGVILLPGVAPWGFAVIAVLWTSVLLGIELIARRRT